MAFKHLYKFRAICCSSEVIGDGKLYGTLLEIKFDNTFNMLWGCIISIDDRFEWGFELKYEYHLLLFLLCLCQLFTVCSRYRKDSQARKYKQNVFHRNSSFLLSTMKEKILFFLVRKCVV